jgi:hypothetical protein
MHQRPQNLISTRALVHVKVPEPNVVWLAPGRPWSRMGSAATDLMTVSVGETQPMRASPDVDWQPALRLFLLGLAFH